MHSVSELRSVIVHSYVQWLIMMTILFQTQFSIRIRYVRIYYENCIREPKKVKEIRMQSSYFHKGLATYSKPHCTRASSGQIEQYFACLNRQWQQLLCFKKIGQIRTSNLYKKRHRQSRLLSYTLSYSMQDKQNNLRVTFCTDIQSNFLSESEVRLPALQ